MYVYALADKFRLEDTGGNGREDERAGPHDVRGCAEAYSITNGKRLVPAISAFRVLPAPADPVQAVADASCNLVIACRAAVVHSVTY